MKHTDIHFQFNHFDLCICHQIETLFFIIFFHLSCLQFKKKKQVETKMAIFPQEIHKFGQFTAF